MKKFNSKEIIVKGLNGEELKEINAGIELGNLIYEKTSTLDWLQHAKDIYAHKPIELSEEKLQYLVNVLTHPQANIPLMIKEAVINYIKTFKEEKEEELIKQQINN